MSMHSRGMISVSKRRKCSLVSLGQFWKNHMTTEETEHLDLVGEVTRTQEGFFKS